MVGRLPLSGSGFGVSRPWGVYPAQLLPLLQLCYATIVDTQLVSRKGPYQQNYSLLNLGLPDGTPTWPISTYAPNHPGINLELPRRQQMVGFPPRLCWNSQVAHSRH